MPTKRKPEPGDVDFDWGTMDANNVDRLLAEAKGTLSRADELSAETDAPRLAKLPASLAALKQADDTRGPVRKFTEPLAHAGNTAMLAAIPAGVNPAIGTALLAGGGLATLPDYLRKLVAPEGDEDRPGVMETGMAGLAALPASGALRGLRGIAAAVPEADLMGGRALAYEGPQISGRARPAIDKLMASESFANLPKGDVSKAAPRVMSPIERFYAENPGAATGGEGRMTGQFEEGTGGLSDVVAGRVRPYEMPPTELEIPLVKPMDPLERLAARSQERFGRRFRRE